MELKTVKSNLKNGFVTVEELKKNNAENIQKDLLRKIEEIQELNEMTGNFVTTSIIEYMKEFIELEKIKNWINKL